MNSAWLDAVTIHSLLFALAVALTCLGLSCLVRRMARHLRLLSHPTPLSRSFACLLVIGAAGGCGQWLFDALQAHTALLPAAARLICWLAIGAAIGAATAMMTPYMPVPRAVMAGLLGGAAGSLAFAHVLSVSDEAHARFAAIVGYAVMLPLAVRLPLLEFESSMSVVGPDIAPVTQEMELAPPISHSLPTGLTLPTSLVIPQALPLAPRVRMYPKKIFTQGPA